MNIELLWYVIMAALCLNKWYVALFLGSFYFQNSCCDDFWQKPGYYKLQRPHN